MTSRTKRNYNMDKILQAVVTTILLLELLVVAIVIIDTHVAIDRLDAEITAIREEEPIVIHVYKERPKKENTIIKEKEENETQEEYAEEEVEETETQEEEKVEEITIDQADVELLAQLMYAEEGIYIEKYKDQPEKAEKVHKLAGSVVIHRKENNFMGAKTIKDVIYSKGQYHAQTLKRVSEGQEVPDIVYVWAEELLTNGALGPDNMIYQSEFEQGTVYTKIGNQYFGTEEKYI